MIRATARVRMTLEFKGLGGHWGDERATLGELKKHAQDAAFATLSRMLRETYGCEVVLVGKPICTAVIEEPEASP